jgi:hypothetical protein
MGIACDLREGPETTCSQPHSLNLLGRSRLLLASPNGYLHHPSSCRSIICSVVMYSTARRLSLETCEVVQGAFPGAQAARACGRCFSNVFSHLAVVRCRHTSRMLTAAAGLFFAAGLQPAHTGSGWLQGSHHPAADMHSRVFFFPTLAHEFFA